MKVALKLGSSVAQVDYYGGASIEHDSKYGDRLHIPTASGEVVTGFMPPNEAAEFIEKLNAVVEREKERRELCFQKV